MSIYVCPLFCSRENTKDDVTGLHSQKGYTLIELMAVVVLLALISGFFVSRFTFSSSWSIDSALRDLSNKIEFVTQDASSRQVSYEIEFNLQDQSYQVWEVRSIETGEVQNVDTLAGMRTQRQQSRRSEQNMVSSPEDEYVREALQDARPLDELLYKKIFDNPFGENRRMAPLEYPSLAEKVFLPPEVRIEDVLVNNNSAFGLYAQFLRVLIITPDISHFEVRILLSTDNGPAEIVSNMRSGKLGIRYRN